MKTKPKHKEVLIKLLFFLVIVIALTGIIINPKLSLNSAHTGLSIWFNIVLPSLLPFFIISEILIGIGFLDFLGKLLKPFMLPIFNVPGEGIFPLTMSLLSGYPVGAKLTSRLRQKSLITREEGDRLICFTSTSGPLFMLGAVSIGMLNNPKLAPLIVLPHYLSTLILGLFFRFYKKDSRRSIVKADKNIFENLQESYISWIKTKKSIGSLITDSVKESMDTILLIGGLVIFYSVLVEIFFSMKLTNKILYFLSNSLTIDIQLLKGIAIGFFEMTLGCKNIAEANISIINKVLIINFIIGWGGLSVHSQALSFINNTDISSKLFSMSKFLHGILSSIFGYILYIIKYKNYIQPAFSNPVNLFIHFDLLDWIYLISSSTKLVLVISLYMLLFSIFISSIFRTFSKKTN